MQEHVLVPAVCLVQFKAKWVNAYEVAAVEPSNSVLGTIVVLRSGATVILSDIPPGEVTDALVTSMQKMTEPEPPPKTDWATSR